MNTSIARMLTAAIALLAPLLAAGAELREFTARYALTWRGMSAGRSEMQLSKLDGDRWSYVSRSNAQGVFRLALSSELAQTSTFRIVDGRVQPLHFSSDDGTNGRSRDQDLKFDRESHRITGTAETKPVDLPLQPGVLDAMSLQIAVMRMLMDGSQPEHFQMVDKTKIKDYVYSREGEETVKTPQGPQETVIFRSSRPGNQRGTWFWCAPELGYLPVKIERRNGSKVEWSMTLQSVQLAGS